MHYSVHLFGALFIALRVSAETTCRSLTPIHSILSFGLMPVNNETDAPQIRGSVFSTFDCEIEILRHTGERLDANRTILSQSGLHKNSCEIKNNSGVLTIDSYQAIVVDTNGWPLNDVKFDISDLDASKLGWKEASAVLGLRSGTVVTPNISLSENSVLSHREFDIPDETARIARARSGKISKVPGVLYSNPSIVNCHSSMTPERCRASVSFSSPIDTVVIFYMLAARGSVLTGSRANVSPLDTACGCRCHEGHGTRLIAEPVPGLPGQCNGKQAPSDAVCDPSGEQWCKIELLSYYEVTGKALPNGNLACKEKTRNTPMIQGAFQPSPDFSARL